MVTNNYVPIPASAAVVLVVEDDLRNYTMTEQILRVAGIQSENIEWVASGHVAVQRADTLPRVRLILLDIRLPGEDGYEILAQLRARPRYQHTLVVAVTGYVDEVHRARQAGFDGFLGKPLDAGRFPDQLTRILNLEPVWEPR
jgi:two-component system, cell cycle response regulator DivK